MIIEDIKKQKSENGIIHLSEVDKSFEQLYLQTVKREKRFYTTDEIKLLPYATKNNPHKNEWQLRTKSFIRFKNYFALKKTKLNILDVGCGNCWMIGQLSKEFEHNYYGIDVNLAELEIASNLFNSGDINLIYADFLTANLPANSFDVIILNSSLQYFADISALMKEVFYVSKSYGEIHIIDTPFYDQNNLAKEKNRSLKRFMGIGLSEMANKYFHHTLNELKNTRFKVLYNPYSMKNKLSNIIFEQDSPHLWIMITH